MAIFESAYRFVGTLISIVHTRAELVAVELEEESLRLFAYLVLSLLALFCAGVAVLLSVFLIVAFYWESHRIMVLFSLIGFFSALSLLIGFGIWYCYQRKPKFLAYSLSELSEDARRLNSLSSQKR